MLWLLLRLLLLAATVQCGCYFPLELQGQFVMQSTVLPSSTVQYSKVNITADAIPIWGHCHRRYGNNVILRDDSGRDPCIRCFHLALRSRNVLQVHTEGLDKCYTIEEAALATCPQQHLLHASREIMLFKKFDLSGQPIQEEYCPISGRYTFVYNVYDGSENEMECAEPSSEMDNCPQGSAINFRFRRCSFPNYNVTYHCLGQWDGPNNQKYLVLLNQEATENHPPYRCLLYQEDDGTGDILMAFSSDSTCRSDLFSVTRGYEMYSLTAVQQYKEPMAVLESSCQFPVWAQGRWQHMTIKGNTLTYHDYSTLKTYTMRCLGPNTGNQVRFSVFARTQCGEEFYKCVWLVKRSINVLEFQIGSRSLLEPSNSLCANENFQDKIWITQGRLDRKQETPCPISGEYTGIIPDETILCAKLSSDCKSPEIMYYTVSDCSRGEVYEEREYRCLGQWEEDGLTYTYTQRKDVGTYECFVGRIISKDKIFIKEAGDYCQRGIDPHEMGMQLNRQGLCTSRMYDLSEWSKPSQSTPSWQSNKYPIHTTPWKPITAPPHKTENRDNAASNSSVSWTVLVALMAILMVP